ncbi:alpha/beta-hydrolase [Massarina eburnea CBS 473.64]|uniref:Alpha/beta-hydrolase n=1 Tax=Massarina eburnea CBS 473.64 TaxID=1395130 RepID=A0A6A6RFW2_9PLEO|nr:alpha/beta-hydrolase [Massarina eburnea CBS 473.64]
MKSSILSLVSASLAAFVAGHGISVSPNASGLLTVKTPTGKYAGFIDPVFPRTRQFRSIAFAQPPVKSLRWEAPQKLPPSDQVHNAYDLPPSCPQFISRTPSFSSEFFPGGAMIYNGDQNHTSGLVGTDTSEDCLYLAIWTPTNATSSSKLPVLFFMTGGGFQGGGVNLPYQLPMDWVERSQSHIVITINYRVNIFGFPNARGASEQNLGILDQRTALEWVRDNIANFGGDPAAITQWGQSAGSMSADIHAHAYYDDPIARAYILQSGTVFSGAANPANTFLNFSFVAQHFGCNSTSTNGTAELACMKAVPFQQITNFVGQYGDSGATPALSFQPQVDERIVFSDYPARIAAGKVARLPTILSTTANEGSTLVPYTPTGISQDIILQVTLSGFVCPTFNSTVERNHLDIPIYRYQQGGQYPNLNPLNWTGAYHGSDIPLNFGTVNLVTTWGNATQLTIDTSRAMQQHILAFAKDPLNGPEELGWKRFNSSAPNGGELIRFGADGKVAQYVDGIEIDGVCQGLGGYNAFP